MTTPLKPSEIDRIKTVTIPDVVIEAFNELILKEWDGHSACFRQETVEQLIVKKGIKAKDLYENHWLDVEGIFRKAGWDVDFDKPGYNETYPSTFTFRKKKR